VDEEEILLTCPCCSASLRIDETGDLEEVERHLDEDERVGIRGLTVVEANPGWELRAYNNNQQQGGKYQPPAHMVPGKAGCIINEAPAPVEPDPVIEAANKADLRERNLI
jgi:hypothetical protein